jgi:hypothetical protein
VNFSELKDIVTTVAAFAGLLLGIYNVVERRHDKRPRLKVQLSIAQAEEQDINLKVTVQDVIGVEIINSGERTLYLDMVQVLIGPQSLVLTAHRMIGKQTYPTEILPSQNTLYEVNMTDVALLFQDHGLSGNLPIRARVRDSLGNQYYSNETNLAESVVRKAQGKHAD